MKKNLPYKSLFGSLLVKPIVSAEKDKYLSTASIEQLKKFLPDVDIEKNTDLLPISFSACVVNRVNRNKDVITTATALKIYKTFINKPINIEHNSKKVVGCIVSAGFSEFGTEKPLTYAEVKDIETPFNITLGGVIWKNVSEELADMIEDCADPDSENYLKISASWELAYKEFAILKIKGDSKNSEDGILVKDEGEISEIKNYLTCFSGSGKKDDENLYSCPIGGVLAIGIGLTENPAAEVAGVAYKETPEKQSKASGDTHLVIENTNIISHDKVESVKHFSNMKITSLKDITDENLKVVQASAITDYVAEEIQKANSAFLKEKEEKDSLVKAHSEEISSNKKSLEDSNKQLEELKKELSQLKANVQQKLDEDLFTARMTEFDEEFELDDEDRSVLASQLKGMNEESFAAFKKNTKVFFKGRKKNDKSKMKEEEKTEKVKASVEEGKEANLEEKKNVAGEAIANAKAQTPSIPNTPPSEKSLKEKWANAFSDENILIKKR